MPKSAHPIAESTDALENGGIAAVNFSLFSLFYLMPVNTGHYCLTKISIRAKRSISRVFSLFIVASAFFVHCPYKSRINRTESVLTELKPY